MSRLRRWLKEGFYYGWLYKWTKRKLKWVWSKVSPSGWPPSGWSR